VPPALGRTLFQLATSHSIALFEVELAAFAQAIGACPQKQIVLVLDPAGMRGHTSRKLRVPDHIHLLFLPPHSPELQPTEQLWPLAITALVNALFPDLETTEGFDAQLACCVVLQRELAQICSTALF